MPPAADESHTLQGIPNEPGDAEGEESDDYDIEDDEDDEPEYAEDDEEEGEPNGQAGGYLTTLLLGETAGAVEEEEDEEDDDEEYAEEVEGDGKDSSALGSVKRGRDGEQEGDAHEDDGQDAKKVKV